jgi:ATP-dependent DNA helicase RecG
MDRGRPSQDEHAPASAPASPEHVVPEAEAAARRSPAIRISVRASLSAIIPRVSFYPPPLLHASMPLPIATSDLFTGTVVEWERLEFKAGWNDEAALHTICGFANDLHNWGGGYLVIGVAEQDGRPTLPPAGLSPREVDQVLKDIVRIANRIVPAYHPIAEPVTVSGKAIVVIWAPGGQTRPYKAPVSLARGEKEYAYYVRTSSSTVRAKGPLESELMQLSATVPYDDRMHHGAELRDLSLRLIQAHLQEIGSDLFEASVGMDFAALCQRMQIVDGPPENLRPRNVGLLFFSESPQRFFPQATIDVVHFPRGPAHDFQEQRFAGPVPRQLRDALSYIRSRFVTEHVVKLADRAEAERFYTYPYRAIEEALANAVYHRGYDVREPIEVRATPEEITVTSYPGPDASVGMERLNSGGVIARRYRNRRVGEFLKELHLTEGRGTGVPTVFRVMRENGSPDPSFEIDAHRSYLTITLPIHPLSAGQPSDTVVENTGDNGFRRAASDSRLLLILELAREPVSRRVLQDELHIRNRSHLQQHFLRPLLNAGLLRMTIPSNPRAKDQAYQTTEEGVALLEANR